MESKVLHKRTVLIVEDNDLNREILASLLENEYEILTAENGKAGLEILHRHYCSISVILLDVFMPVCSGFEFLKIIGEDPVLSNIPVIVTTGSESVSDEIQCLRLGACDFIRKPYNSDVVISRVRNMIKLKESVTTLEAVEYDHLTGVYTMEAFQHHAASVINTSGDRQFNLLLIEPKDFELVNNIFGKTEGDRVITDLAKVIKKWSTDGIVGRQGVKFYVLMTKEECSTLNQLMKDQNELVKKSHIPQLKIKYGLYRHIDKEQDITVLCERAQFAAMSIWNSHFRQIAEYDESVRNQIVRDQYLESNFTDALKNGEIQVWYQPKVDSVTEEIVAAEALARWIRPDGTNISPAVFIPLLEKNGMISILDKYVFQKVCQFQKNRMERGEKLIPVSINLSRNSLYQPNMVSEYADNISEYGIPVESIPIELTESADVTDDYVTKYLNDFRRKGFRLHLDDFGTGYSSLATLMRMPFDVLKLDKSLIDLQGSMQGDAVIRHICALAKEIGLEVVAEGVESAQQAHFLKTVHCDQMQGYYYYRPQPYSGDVAFVNSNPWRKSINDTTGSWKGYL